MTRRDANKKMYFRPLPEAKRALKKLLFEMGEPELLGEVLQEDFVAASWMWMLTLDRAFVADGVRPYVERFKAELGTGSDDRAGAPDPAPAPAEASSSVRADPDALGPKKARGRKATG